MSRELLVSIRGKEMPESPIRKLAPLTEIAEKIGIKIYRLNIGQPDLPTPKKALKYSIILIENFLNTVLHRETDL